MRLRWHRYEEASAPPKEDLDAALRSADRALTEARQLRCRADEVTDKLSKTRERNHFAAAVVRSFRGV